MKKIEKIIAFDVDGTLIDIFDNERTDITSLLKTLKELGAYIVVWSGGGQSYARLWVSRLGLEDYVDEVMAKDNNLNPDIAFDDVGWKYSKNTIII